MGPPVVTEGDEAMARRSAGQRARPMPLGDSLVRCRSLPLLALGLVAFAAGCQIRVGDAAGRATEPADDCMSHGSRECHAKDAVYASARADWAKRQQQFDAT